ncbi:glycosyltransferase family 2 protein [Luteococcus sp. H138]|uniref:glycosyltransferase family 2 protein n=1 Tax=unclassified Luteococcus TaxID=2639923 RepID=UPI00313C3096
MTTTLSIVVPCYREADNLARLHEELSALDGRLDAELEIIIVDDGSPDDTFDVAREMASRDPRIRVLSFSRNFGKEAAMLAGLRAATGDVVVVMDADLQHPPELLVQMWERIRSGDVGQVVARRTRDGDPAVRTFFSRLYYRTVNSLIDVELTDGVGDFRMLSRPAVDALLLLSERNRFSKGLFAWIGFPVETIDYRNVGRAAGESSWTFRQLVNYGLDGVISFNDRPLRKLTGLGVLATAVGLLYLVYLLFDWAVDGVDAPGYITTIAVVTVLGGIQLLGLALVGEYIGRIYAEVKARPHYIVAHDSARQDSGPDGPQCR